MGAAGAAGSGACDLDAGSICRSAKDDNKYLPGLRFCNSTMPGTALPVS